MSLENIGKIKAASLEDHIESLEYQFNLVRLSYVDRLHQKKIEPLEKSYITFDKENNKTEVQVNTDDLGLLLNRYTDIFREFVIARQEQEISDSSQRVEWTTEKYINISNDYYSKILEFYKEDKNSWIQKILTFLELEKTKAKVNKSKFKKEDKKEGTKEDKERKAGLINFELEDSKMLKRMFDGTSFPLKDGESYMTIHLRSFFIQQYNDKDKNIFSNESLKQLANEIVENYPETKALVAHSWLMDTAIAQRIGFKIYKRETFSDTGGFWGQFQDSNGQLNQEKVNKFLETGVAPYQIATGAIDTVDFLSKYLPKEKKGKITLKEFNDSFNEELYDHDMKVLREELADQWDSLTEEEIKTVFSKCDFLKSFNESDLGAGFFDAVLEFKKTGLPLNKEVEYPKLSSYKEKLDTYIKSVKFKDVEVFIE